MDEGDANVEKGDIAAALGAYQQAHAIMRVPTTGIEVARSLDKLGKLTAALAAARDVVAMPSTIGEPKPFAAAREQAQALVTALEARVPTLTILVKTASSSARPEVSLDGKKLTPEALKEPLALDPGHYRVTATAEDHTAATVEVTLKERDRAQAALALARVLVIPPEPTRATPPPPPPPSLSPFIPAGFTIAGAGILAGVVTGALAISAANEANKLCSGGVCPSEAARMQAQGRYNTADGLAIVADVSFVLALAGVGLGIYGIAAPAKPAAQAPAQGPSASFFLGPGSAKLRVSF